MIDQSEYIQEVEEQANELHKAVSESDQDYLDAVVDVLDSHKWFFGHNELTGAEYGAIVYDFDTIGNVEQFRDPESAMSAFEYADTLQNMAFFQFEADVIEMYKQQQ